MFFFADPNQYNDIALVRLDKPIPQEEWKLEDPCEHDTICPICLPKQNMSEENMMGYILGFGTQFQALNFWMSLFAFSSSTIGYRNNFFHIFFVYKS